MPPFGRRSCGAPGIERQITAVLFLGLHGVRSTRPRKAVGLLVALTKTQIPRRGPLSAGESEGRGFYDGVVGCRLCSGSPVGLDRLLGCGCRNRDQRSTEPPRARGLATVRTPCHRYGLLLEQPKGAGGHGVRGSQPGRSTAVDTSTSGAIALAGASPAGINWKVKAGSRERVVCELGR